MMSSLQPPYEYPDVGAMRRLEALVGIDEQRQRLEKGLKLALNPQPLKDWSIKYYQKDLKLLDSLINRPPLFILTGDVGVGKTALAESIGDAIARSEGEKSIKLWRMSLTIRGSGVVGEMTNLISSAFSEIAQKAHRKEDGADYNSLGCLLLIDEADALVQTRETSQMHHEDRAGVNAFIRGIDDISSKNLSIAVIMCTNRLSALDPALQRRAADIIYFSRPNKEQRRKILTEAFSEAKITEEQIDQIVNQTGHRDNNPSFTFSDLTQRLIPRSVLAAYPNSPLSFDIICEVLKTIEATPAFKGNDHDLYVCMLTLSPED
jgi:SpoVK/Ycf46/Vps4 family AAA+-type ATPase